jgi:hypothetical protein
LQYIQHPNIVTGFLNPPHWYSGTPLPAAERTGAWLSNAWRTMTSGVPERNYQRRALRRMKQGALHATLGLEVRDAEYTRTKAVRWLGRLIELGLRPGHLCVEVGCGSLWCAEAAIHYMQPGRFIGLDTTDCFYEMGKQRLAGLISEKGVRLAVIGRKTVREVAALQPNFIFSRKVLPHVPTRAVPRYLGNITAMMSERTLVVIDNKPAHMPDGSYRGSRYVAADLLPHLPAEVQCGQLPFGLVLRHATYPWIRDVAAA